MNEEQEGVELETINPEEDAIILPNVDDEETEVDESIETEESKNEEVKNNSIDEQKESLQKGVNKERQLRKIAERKNRELEARIKELESKNFTPEKSTVDELIEVGVDENIAKSIANAIEKKSNSNSKTQEELENLKFKMLLTEKSKEEGFEDILDYAEDIKSLVDKGLSIEQSYYATIYTKPTMNTKSEIERKVEAKIQNNIARKEILGTNINSNANISASSKQKVTASREEKAIAAAAGMTVEEYIAIRDMNSIQGYENYKNRKK